MWSALRHPNVLPLLGATMIGTQLAMVSEWMSNGNINEFVKAHPDADRAGLVRFSSATRLWFLFTVRLAQLGDVGKGLGYLHSQQMFHGDLKGVSRRARHHPACLLVLT